MVLVNVIRGIKDLFLPEDGTFEALRLSLQQNVSGSLQENVSGVHIKFTRPESPKEFQLAFDAKDFQELTPGYYKEAYRWPISSPAFNGIAAMTDGRGCTSTTGEFRVIEAEYDEQTDDVQSFAAHYTHYCYRETEDRKLSGTVYYNYEETPPACNGSSETSRFM